MHLPSDRHKDMLPKHVPALPMPDTNEEASTIARCLTTGQVPSAEQKEETGLGLTEEELLIRGA